MVCEFDGPPEDGVVNSDDPSNDDARAKPGRTVL
jgi:hypothetical protein